MPKIALNKGFVTTVDAVDLPLVERWKWHVQATGKAAYARRNITVAGRTHSIYMHRLILGVDEGVCVNGLQRQSAVEGHLPVAWIGHSEMRGLLCGE